MLRRCLCAILLFLAGIQAAAAQATINTRTTGTITSGTSFPGIVDLPVGAPYELRISARFVPEDVSPDTLYSTSANIDSLLIVDGIEHHFTGSGIQAFGYTLLTLNGVAQTSFFQNVVLFLPGGQDVILSNLIYLPASVLPAANVHDVFDIGDFSSVAGGSSGVGAFDNASGRWIGSVSNPAATYELHAMLVPVPEPSAAVMLLAGMGLLGVAAARRRRS